MFHTFLSKARGKFIPRALFIDAGVAGPRSRCLEWVATGHPRLKVDGGPFGQGNLAGGSVAE